MSIYQSIIRPFLFRIPAETAHEIGIETLEFALGSNFAQDFAAKHFETANLGTFKRFGITFDNPLGVAAGFDKNGIAINQLAVLGFGFVEVGTITYWPQDGNEKPRLFRLPDDQALINRLGFNNEGARKVVDRLKKIDRKCILGLNIGKNKNVPVEDAAENYLKSFDLAREVADYIAVNISSPNTPNLRELQKADNLDALLKALHERNRTPPKGGTSNAKPLLVKIGPDLSDSEIEMIVDICLRYHVSGMIATNTTITRDNLNSRNDLRSEIGGLSGKPLVKRSNQVISTIYKYSDGQMPIIGVGGIFTARDAFEKIAAGASLLQAYTGFIYRGPSFARDINAGLARLVKENGFEKLDDVVGSELII